MITRPLPAHWFSLILIFSALSAGGCVFVPVTGGSPVVVQSYNFPDRLDSKTLIQAVELAFVHTLGTTPRIIEGAVLSPLPAQPARFTVTDRRVHLERLGVVTIYEVGCPGNLVIMQAWVTDPSEYRGLHRYTGCIQLYAGGYRVQLIDSRLVAKRNDGLTELADTKMISHPSLLSRLAQAILAQVEEGREVTDSPLAESVSPDRLTYENASASPYLSAREGGQFSSALSEKPAGSPAPRGLDEDVVTTTPLVCLAPKHEAAAVRAQYGIGKVIQVLERGSLMAVSESVDAAYFHVKTKEGLAGWVNRSDVRRLPCPIG